MEQWLGPFSFWLSGDDPNKEVEKEDLPPF
jgi:hypothetical protein